MRLGYVILFVADVPATVDFYERAFGLARRFVDPSQTYGEMETGATALAFVAESLASAQHLNVRPNRRDVDPAGMEIALVSDDVAAAYDRAVAAGATGLALPAEKPWGQTVAYLRDPNGCLVELCSPIA